MFSNASAVPVCGPRVRRAGWRGCRGSPVVCDAAGAAPLISAVLLCQASDGCLTAVAQTTFLEAWLLLRRRLWRRSSARLCVSVPCRGRRGRRRWRVQAERGDAHHPRVLAARGCGSRKDLQKPWMDPSEVAARDPCLPRLEALFAGASHALLRANAGAWPNRTRMMELTFPRAKDS